MPIILQWPSKPWRMVYVFHCHTSFVELWGEFTPGIGICSWSPWISGRAPRSLPGPWPPRYHPRCRRPAHNHCLSWKWSKITEITQYGCMFSYMKPCHAINLWPIFFCPSSSRFWESRSGVENPLSESLLPNDFRGAFVVLTRPHV